jgi:hypothetical protein
VAEASIADCRLPIAETERTTMADSTNLLLPYIEASQGQKHVTHNEAIRLLDALIRTRVVEQGLTTPPGSPADGTIYVPGSGATGAWSAWDFNLAYYVDGAWQKIVPAIGWLIYDIDQDAYYRYAGAPDYWSELPGFDIESGSFTPTLTFATPGDLGVSYAAQNGRYLRIADFVLALIHLQATPTHTTASGAARVAGLPFSVDNPLVATPFQHNANLTYPSGNTSLLIRPEAGTTYCQLIGLGSGSTGSPGTAQMPSGATQVVRGFVIYERA